mmetsp:Transcript_82502/g.220488  ORF Transcript_82502/g.220488 Transcript_82502/m.220488 type:complete len:221 (+) Transcript_82502:424-1086(+)
MNQSVVALQGLRESERLVQHLVENLCWIGLVSPEGDRPTDHFVQGDSHGPPVHCMSVPLLGLLHHLWGHVLRGPDHSVRPLGPLAGAQIRQLGPPGLVEHHVLRFHVTVQIPEVVQVIQGEYGCSGVELCRERSGRSNPFERSKKIAAVQQLEQEKNMVAVSKRLVVGNDEWVVAGSEYLALRHKQMLLLVLHGGCLDHALKGVANLGISFGVHPQHHPE